MGIFLIVVVAVVLLVVGYKVEPFLTQIAEKFRKFRNFFKTTPNIKKSNGNLQTKDNCVFQLDIGTLEDLANSTQKGWKIHLDEKCFEDHLKVFVLGAFKTGKSTLINQLFGKKQMADEHVYDNTIGERGYEYYDGAQDKKLLLIDTEGLFQSTSGSRNSFLRTFFLNHIQEQATVIIYVMERTFIHDVELIKELYDLYTVQDSRINKIYVVHNFKDVKITHGYNPRDIQKLIVKNTEMFPDYNNKIKASNPLELHKKLIHAGRLDLKNNKGKVLNHVVLFNKDSPSDLNSATLSILKQRLTAFDTTPTSIKKVLPRIITKTMFEHYDLSSVTKNKGDASDLFEVGDQRITLKSNGAEKVVLPKRSGIVLDYFMQDRVLVDQVIEQRGDKHYLIVIIKCTGIFLNRALDNNTFEETANYNSSTLPKQNEISFVQKMEDKATRELNNKNSGNKIASVFTELTDACDIQASSSFSTMVHRLCEKELVPCFKNRTEEQISYRDYALTSKKISFINPKAMHVILHKVGNDDIMNRNMPQSIFTKTINLKCSVNVHMDKNDLIITDLKCGIIRISVLTNR